MKGYLTVFLSLSLSVMTGFILLLTGCAVRNAGRIRLECAVDTGMNSVLSEFHIGLFERYGLLYVDASYLGKEPSVSNLEERIHFYVEENTSKALERKNGPWGTLYLEKVQISGFETSAAAKGASMRNQAVCYAADHGLCGSEREVLGGIQKAENLDTEDVMGRWHSIMEQLSGMERPYIRNEKGEWEEVPLSNPADWVYGLSGSDILYLAEVPVGGVSSAMLSLNEYISHRGADNPAGAGRNFREEDDLFVSYLFDKMGYLGGEREKSLLSCQLEYIIYGNSSDMENVRAVAQRLFRWRFADNLSCALSDGGLRGQAAAVAEELHAVQLKREFKEPVTESILYACAFLESIGDLRSIYRGGVVPVGKSRHQMSADKVLNGIIYRTESGEGWTYGQYLASMIFMMDKTNVNLRAMDIMEMDIRFGDGNRNFAMDWCVERIEAEIVGQGSYGDKYLINREYGYF